VLDAELPNLRNALTWGFVANRPETVGLATALVWYWDSRRLFIEGRETLERALRAEDLSADNRVDALLGAAWLAERQGDLEAARSQNEEARRLAAADSDPLRQARAAHQLGRVLHRQLAIDASVEAFNEALGLDTLPVAERADALRGAGWARSFGEGHGVAIDLHREARELLERVDDPALVDHYVVETNLLIGAGLKEEASALADRAVAVARDRGGPVAFALEAKANATQASGDRELLQEVLGGGIEAARAEGDRLMLMRFHERLAHDAIESGQPERVRQAVDDALDEMQENSDLDERELRARARLWTIRAGLAEDEGELELADELLRQAAAVYVKASSHDHLEVLVALIRFRSEHGDAGGAAALKLQAEAALERADSQIGTLVRIDLAVLDDDINGAIDLTTRALAEDPPPQPRDVLALRWRHAALLMELSRPEEAAAELDEVLRSRAVQPRHHVDRARAHIAMADAATARTDLLDFPRAPGFGWAGFQLTLATTLARLAMLEGRRERATELWGAVGAYRSANRRLVPPLARRFEEPLDQLEVDASPPILDSPTALAALRARVADEMAALGADPGSQRE
jgi:tetratricopeptide (TPR) repeat protein